MVDGTAGIVDQIFHLSVVFKHQWYFTLNILLPTVKIFRQEIASYHSNMGVCRYHDIENVMGTYNYVPCSAQQRTGIETRSE